MDRAPYALFKKGTELLEAGYPAHAAVLLERVKDHYPRKGSVREALGRAYFNCKKFSKAKEEFEASIDIDPTNHYAHYGLGLSSFQLGERRLAIKHLKIAVALDGDEKYREALSFLE